MNIHEVTVGPSLEFEPGWGGGTTIGKKHDWMTNIDQWNLDHQRVSIPVLWSSGYLPALARFQRYPAQVEAKVALQARLGVIDAVPRIFSVAAPSPWRLRSLHWSPNLWCFWWPLLGREVARCWPIPTEPWLDYLSSISHPFVQSSFWMSQTSLIEMEDPYSSIFTSGGYFLAKNTPLHCTLTQPIWMVRFHVRNQMLVGKRGVHPFLSIMSMPGKTDSSRVLQHSCWDTTLCGEWFPHVSSFSSVFSSQPSLASLKMSEIRWNSMI